MDYHFESELDIKDYQLSKFLGNGSFGKVFTCYLKSDPDMKEFAIKIMPIKDNDEE